MASGSRSDRVKIMLPPPNLSPPAPASLLPPTSRNAPAPSHNGVAARTTKSFTVTSGVQKVAQKTIIYGPGGCGKTSLCASIRQCGIEPLILDLDDGSHFLDVDRIGGRGSNLLKNWESLRDALHSEDLWRRYGAVVIDSLTKAEELAGAWTIANVKTEKGDFVKSIEGYGYGKGFSHLYETFLHLLGDLDAHAQAGRQVICVAHECTANVPNPTGENFLRYEPRLSSPASGKSSVRNKCKEWADNVCFIGYDQTVNKDGKAVGCGSRAIYPTERPSWMAKSRTLSEDIVYEKGNADLWKMLLA